MRKLLFLVLVVSSLASCNQPGCPKDQLNTVLNSNDPNSPGYQAELVQLLKSDQGSVKYYFDGKSVEDGMNLWYINAYGSGYCGRLKLFVDKEDVNVLRLNQSKGYCGAKLSGLQYELKEVDEHIVPFYTGLRSIVDQVILDKNFFLREDVVTVSRDLLGKLLVTEVEGIISSGIIVETEAYRGPDDLGCHAYNNRRTERTEIMYAEGGVAYVYVCYGIHDMFNVVTAPEGKPHAVLIRAIEPLENVDIITSRRGHIKPKRNLTNGPGKVGAALGITKQMNGSDLRLKKDIWILDNGNKVKDEAILTGPRVGMSKHVGHCSNWPWRFRIKDNPYTSKPDKVWYDWT